ncbi:MULTISPECIES: hypothetical protein [Sphingomonas]|uniref:hypothetical protein n=1 Tax=Sphingomonas TaxID=13687 RepID=UPI000F7E19EE|nr:hypothetical protein [Sphingomonas sp. ABOLF]GLK19329.1 hypothetical protein GCM10017606_01550 [Microbacterium terregens]
MRAMVEMEQVWDRTAAFLRARRATLVALALPALFVPAVIGGLAETAAAQDVGASAGIWMPVRLVAGLLMLWAELAILALAAGLDSPRAAFRQAGLRLPVVIGFALLVTALLLLLAMPAAAILVAFGFDFVAAAAGESVTPSVAAAAWIALYALVLIPLLLWVAARLSLLPPVILEERRGLRAIARTFTLTRGLAAKIIGMFLLYGIVSTVLTAATQYAGGTILALIFGSDDGLGVASVLTLLLTTLVETALAVMLWVFTGKLYLAARERQDGTAAHR